MYFYLYDTFLVNKKYERLLSGIETKIASFGISGPSVHLNILKNTKEIIQDNINSKEIDTVVVIGGDKLVSQAASALAGSKIPLGFIPIFSNSSLAPILGIPTNDFAVDTLANRLIKTIDLGKVNNQYFLSNLQISDHRIIITSNNSCQIIPDKKIKQINIYNLACLKNFDQQSFPSSLICCPQDQQLEVILSGQSNSLWSLIDNKKSQFDSLFYLNKLKIEANKPNKFIPVLIDNYKTIKTPLDIEIASQKLKIIVGRRRLF